MTTATILHGVSPRTEPGSWRPGIWTYSLALVWLALLASVMLVGQANVGRTAGVEPAIEEPMLPII